jgi:nucleoside-diphosphate-sugar epimerase
MPSGDRNWLHRSDAILHRWKTFMATDPKPTALILGANGRFGLAAAQAFDAAGWQVVAPLRRDPVPGMPAGVRVLRVPIEHTDALAREAHGASVVVHAVNPVYTRWDTELLPTARAGMDVAQRLGARFMLPGNVYNFGTRLPARLTEQTPQRADTRKGAQRIALEAEIERRCEAGLLTATVIRAGDFYGAGTGSWFDQAVVKSLRSGKLIYPGPTKLPHAWAYLPDLARAFVAVAGRAPDECGRFERFHFAGHTLTGAELLAGIERAAAALGVVPDKPWSHGTLPWGVIRIGGLLMPMWRELARMSYLWRTSHAFDGSALTRAVGSLPSTPVDEALRDALRSLGHGRQPARGPVAVPPQAVASKP